MLYWEPKQGLALGALYKLRHGEGLATAGHAEHLVALIIIYTFDESMALGCRRWVKFRDHFKGLPALGLLRPIGAMRNNDKFRFAEPRFSTGARSPRPVKDFCSSMWRI